MCSTIVIIYELKIFMYYNLLHVKSYNIIFIRAIIHKCVCIYNALFAIKEK